MSFQATHLHFAYQTQDTLKIKNKTDYFSGVLYPDSRYITKIDRTKTHRNVRINPDEIFKLKDDFQKGWQIHLLYDKLALPRLYEIMINKTYQTGEMDKLNIWIPVTAGKWIEDLYWWEKTDWSKIIPFLKPVKYPFNENPKILASWYDHFIDFFQNSPNLDDYNNQAAFMKINNEIIQQVNKKTHQIYADKIKRIKIQKIMIEVLNEFNNKYSKYEY